ncbi:uncharacterized protein TM35_000074120 [Trypanosoma theileri]|uniref:Transmembrane protein n=1 Tax=Trypanosoma theileri TaxID=67003 RepID=A0A1X0P2C7_9TRYP|nr:uncharacterized protein TM35_000074120 [Trypanosoma theileri]ORC90988.1 hypothetical protein TM35_000074120 [Trypanosoma theileri]
MSSIDVSNRHDVEVTIAIASTIIYAVLLFLGSIILFLWGSKNTFFLSHKSSRGFWFLFVFSLIPTVLFLGIIGPWICVAYNSLSGAVVFLIVPGVLLFLLILSWCALQSETNITTNGTLDLDNL